MSITLIQTPNDHTPAYNHQAFWVSGSNYAQPNYKYVVTVDVDGDLTEQKIEPRPDNNYLYFNPQRIVESYVKNDYQFDIDEPTPATDSIKLVTVAISEEYGSPVSGFSASSGDYYVWNAAYQAHDFSTYSFATTTKAKHLDLMPDYTHTVHIDQKYALMTWHRGFSTQDIRELLIDCYDSAGLNIQTTVIYNQYYNTAVIDERLLITVNCSPYGLNLIETNNPSLVLSKFDPLQDIIPSTTARYELIWYTAGLGAMSSDTTYFTVSDFCSVHERYTLHFLNRLGGMTPFVFNLLSAPKSTIERKSYINTPFEYTGIYNYSNSISGKNNYNTVITNRITLNSDWVNEDTYLALKDLFTSPLIKLEDENGNLYAVTCTMKDYQQKKRVNDKIFNVTIDVDFDYEDIRQRG